LGGKQRVSSVHDSIDSHTSGSYSASAFAASSPVSITIGSIVIVSASPVCILLIYASVLSIDWMLVICVDPIAALNIAAISPKASSSTPVNGLSSTCAYAKIYQLCSAIFSLLNTHNSSC